MPFAQIIFGFSAENKIAVCLLVAEFGKNSIFAE